MRKCWRHNPDKRPLFSELASEIVNILTSIAGYLELETITGIVRKPVSRGERRKKCVSLDTTLEDDGLKKQDVLTPVGIAIHLDPSDVFESSGGRPHSLQQNGSVSSQSGKFKMPGKGSMESVSSCGSEVAAIMGDHTPGGEFV